MFLILVRFLWFVTHSKNGIISINEHASDVAPKVQNDKGTNKIVPKYSYFVIKKTCLHIQKLKFEFVPRQCEEKRLTLRSCREKLLM